jgi:hypothetical protein
MSEDTGQEMRAAAPPERVAVEIAVGPNTEGTMEQVRQAHGIDAPDPANVDDTGEFNVDRAPGVEPTRTPSSTVPTDQGGALPLTPPTHAVVEPSEPAQPPATPEPEG